MKLPVKLVIAALVIFGGYKGYQFVDQKRKLAKLAQEAVKEPAK